MKPVTAKIKQNDNIIWEGRIQFNESRAILDLKSINGYEKFVPLHISFYKKPSLDDEMEWISNSDGEKNFFILSVLGRGSVRPPIANPMPIFHGLEEFFAIVDDFLS